MTVISERILAVVNIEIPIEVGYDFITYFRSEKFKESIEKNAINQVSTIAEAVLNQ